MTCSTRLVSAALVLLCVAVAFAAAHAAPNRHPRVAFPSPPSPWSAPNPRDDLRPLPYPSPPLPQTVYVYDTDPYSADDVFLLLSLEGQLARLNASPARPANASLLYHVTGTNRTQPEWVYFAEYPRLIPSVTFSSRFLTASAREVITFFRAEIQGAYLTTLHTDSVNVCVSMASLTAGVVCATSAHADLLKALGVPVLKDVSNVTETAFLDAYLSGTTWPFSTRFVSCQIADKAITSLSDWTILIGAVQLHRTDSYLRVLDFLHASHPTPLFNAVFGWVTDDSAEWNYTGAASSADAGVLASDWMNNLATHVSLSAPWERGLVNPTKTSPSTLPSNAGKHTAALLFTDGDNICSDMNLLLDRMHWAHPQCGTVPIGWGLNPTLALTAPIGLHSYYAQAVPENDGVVAFSAQYAFPERMTPEGRQQWAELSAQAMAAADLRVMNLIGNNFSSTYFEPLLSQWNIDGVVFWPFYGNYVLPSPDNGSVLWIHGKPVISSRASLWQDHSTPESIAAMLNQQARDPTATAGYSIIAVHIWSETVESLIQLAKLLDDDVLLVKPDELIELMTQNVRNKSS